MESPVLETPKTLPEKAKQSFKNKVYEVEGNKIHVSWKEFFPANKESPQNEAVLFLTGWSAGTAKTLESLSQHFANDSKKSAFLITTRPEKVVPCHRNSQSSLI